ncbi:hypothetical protein DKM19_27235 [Streptosporangium sp. 'caverna']|nr:hypothetical protein DKM19_27235 [Streptosporangium sp. 'caverna']
MHIGWGTACLYAAAGRFSRGGVWAPGGPRGLQNRRGRGSRPGGFDSRPPPLHVLPGKMSRVGFSGRERGGRSG